MKLKNKKTGEIGNLNAAWLLDTLTVETPQADMPNKIVHYNSLAELNAEWEDASEEPKKYWFIDAYGNIVQNEITKHYGDEYTDMTDAYESQKQIGNHFETPEEAEKAVEKLKALKRLKDNWWLKPKNWHRVDDDTIVVRFGVGVHIDMPIQEDLDLLFGGEE